MLTSVKIDGVCYHAQWRLDSDGNVTDDAALVLDEAGDPIPCSQCICFAREPNECVCGAWDDVDLDDWYDD